MSKLEVSAEAIAHAAPEAVWNLVSDATKYPEWGPWSAAAYRSPGDASPHGPGAVYWLRSASRAYGRYVTTVERVLDAHEGRFLAYTVIGGIPVTSYRGEVTLTPVAEGTRIHWAATWDSTLRGRLVHNGLRKFFPQVVKSLAAAAEKTTSSPQP